jgi:hypothetical protein
MPLFDQREFAPVTKTELLEEELEEPMIPAALVTFPPLEMTRLLLKPADPIVLVLVLDSSVLVLATIREFPKSPESFVEPTEMSE